MITKPIAFQFSDILFLSSQDLKLLLCHIENATLLLACYKYDRNLIDRIASELSSKGRAYFLEDLGKVGQINPVNPKDQKCSQEEIEITFKRLFYTHKIKNWPIQLVS